jgi:RNA polymerase sigma-70 factor (TIGR02960 family)
MSEEAQLLARAQSGDETAFEALSESFRARLEVHCYRMVGSVQDAEDLVQETLTAAWQSLERFERRSSLRTWLYRIATNRCLNHVRDRGRRLPELPAPTEPLPTPPPPTRLSEPVWLEPYPEVLLEGIADRGQGPDVRYEAREAIGLAFMFAVQRLPPRQRAVLVLRDVLGFRAAEAADMLGMTEVAVNRTLQRARQSVDRNVPPGALDAAPLPGSAEERQLVWRFATAFQAGDIPGVVALLTDDALLTMPPEAAEYEGAEAIGRFLSTVPAAGALERFRLIPSRANGQPAFGCYLKDPHTPIARAYGLMVLALRGDRVAALAGFVDTSVFPFFGLPRTLRDETAMGDGWKRS